MAKRKKKPAQPAPAFRDRVKEFRRVKAAELLANPANWRKHPEPQKAALTALLHEVGFAGALLAREIDGGQLELIDGHLRAETAPEMELPVLILDVDEREAAKLLAMVDPIGEMAKADRDKLESLIRGIETGNDELQSTLAKLAERHGVVDLSEEIAEREEVEVPASYQVVIECTDEADQKQVYDKLTQEGRTCRVLTL